jgi:hypothetical protein
VAKEVARLGTLASALQPYQRYRRGYELLAEALRVSCVDLYLQLWPHETGTLRQAFTDVVDDLYHQDRGRSLSLQERRDVQVQADLIFDTTTEMLFDRSIERWIRREWHRRFP